MLVADAAHRETWNFLSAVVFPDVVWARFPDLHEDRFLGHQQRNALRRVWRRQEMLGELLGLGGPHRLKEDELVGLLERSALARNRRLVVAAATVVLQRGAMEKRDHWARDFYKRLTHVTGPLLLDVLHDDELTSLVNDVAAGGSWNGDDASLKSMPTNLEGSIRDAGTWEAPDLVRAFHESMVHVVHGMAELHIDTSTIESLVRDEGGVAAAIRIAGASRPGPEFAALAAAGRLDLSVEALAVSDTYRGLFSAPLLEVSATRLGEYLGI